jgi:hypothetical protein
MFVVEVRGLCACPLQDRLEHGMAFERARDRRSLQRAARGASGVEREKGSAGNEPRLVGVEAGH